MWRLGALSWRNASVIPQWIAANNDTRWKRACNSVHRCGAETDDADSSVAARRRDFANRCPRDYTEMQLLRGSQSPPPGRCRVRFKLFIVQLCMRQRSVWCPISSQRTQLCINITREPAKDARNLICIRRYRFSRPGRRQGPAGRQRQAQGVKPRSRLKQHPRGARQRSRMAMNRKPPVRRGQIARKSANVVSIENSKASVHRQSFHFDTRGHRTGEHEPSSS